MKNDRLNRKIRVLVLCPNLRPSNGVSAFIMSFFRRLDHDLVHMDFALYADRETPYYDEIRAVSDSRIFILKDIRHYRAHVRQCQEILSAGRYDVIHDNALHISWPMMHAAEQYGVPVRILNSHNTKAGDTKLKMIRNTLFMPLLVSTANRYAACSTEAGKVMFGRKPFVVLPTIIDNDMYAFDPVRREAVRQKLGAGDKRIILTVGRTAAQKNPFFAIDVISELYKLDRNIEYWWIGSGPLDSKMQNCIDEKNLSHVIRLFGSRDSVIDYYQAADLFFLPSKFEGLGLALIEAQAMGLPCVVSDIVTSAAVFTDLVQKLSLQVSPADWAKIIHGWLNRNPDRAGYQECLKQSRFTDEKLLDTLYDLYKPQE